MKKPELKLIIPPRSANTIPVQFSPNTLASLRRVAKQRNVSCQTLIKIYVELGLRQDMDKLFSEDVLETAAKTIAQRFQSKNDITNLLDKIRG